MSEISFFEILNEYCGKMKVRAPEYTLLRSRGSYVYAVEAFEKKASGFGATEDEAKNHAASNLINILRLYNHNIIEDDNNDEDCEDCEDCEQISEAAESDKEISEYLNKLYDYCAKQKFPLPKIRFASDKKSYKAEFRLASIEGFGCGKTKVDAVKNAAQSVFEEYRKTKIISVSKPEVTKPVEQEPRKAVKEPNIFKVFGHLTGRKIYDNVGYSLRDKHNYFTTLDLETKNNALAVFKKDYPTIKEQIDDLLKSLSLTPTYGDWGNMRYVEFDCKYDIFLVAKEEKMDEEILEYFRVMLN